MQIDILSDSKRTGIKAAEKGADLIREAIASRGKAFIILATGASQFNLLEALTAENDIDWSVVTLFHLDEYVGVDESHPASFVRYLKERFLQQVPEVQEFVFINGDARDLASEISRVSSEISNINIDVAFVGIGENGHLAFNDPPANFDTEEPYICVDLDEKCRQQQAGEGWFPSLADVPDKAISMSIRQIMKSNAIICTVPDIRKADAVHNVLDGEISNMHPASILQSHQNTYVFLDQDAASKLARSTNA